MTRPRFLSALLCALLLTHLVPGPARAQAACYADYKARHDRPYELIYGVAGLSRCDKEGAEAELRARLARAGWTLLELVSIFEADGLEQRKADAGTNYLRF